MNKWVQPPKLKPGDTVRFVSPASTPAKNDVNTQLLRDMGLKVEIAPHAFDEYGYLAGTDEDRLADLNDAIRDPNIKAIIATRGGKGAYRIADGMDFAALNKNPKLLIGFSEITILHMAILKHCGIAGIHGAPWDAETFGQKTAESFVRAAFTTKTIIIKTNPDEPTKELTTHGKVTGRLIGGNQDSIATAAGWASPSFEGAILLLEAFNMRLGHIDRQLTMLMNSRALRGVTGVVVGQYTDCDSDATTQGDWTYIDVLRDRLDKLGVPILGGLSTGHGKHPLAVPIGTIATLDADAGVLQIAPAVC